MRAALLSTVAVTVMTLPLAAQDLDQLSAADLLPLAQAEGAVTVYAFTSRIG
jgi:iron(III) transport system substrate-binding protein